MTQVATARAQPIYLAGQWVTSSDRLVVDNPARPGEPAGQTWRADADQYEQAVNAAVAAFDETRRLPAYERGRILREISAGISDRRVALARIMTLESGKPIKDALVEVDRGAFTFRVAAEEAERMIGETIPLDLMPSSRGRLGITRRFPLGPVAAISPFNFPLNLAAHKVAPAIAAGCSIVLKPPSKDPLTMLAVAEIIDHAGLPAGAVSVLPMSRELGDRMVEDDRFKLLTFTGSPAVGWPMKARAGHKRVVLELGGNAGVIVDAGADIAWAAKRTAAGGFGYAGQTCISAQRVFVHEDVHDEYLATLTTIADGLVVGDPLEATTDVGPMVDDRAVTRIRRWIDEAVDLGGRVVTGGHDHDGFVRPTILADVPRHAAICAQEAFAPVVIVEQVATFEAALDAVNDSVYGLQTGVFTPSLDHAWRAFERLEVGGVVVNDVSTYRIDHMPYGGVKDSGLGREGLRWSIEDMTELRLMVLAQPG